jgi:tetratricopeptide (TPR) repeat protein
MSEGMHSQPDPVVPLVGRGAELRAAWGLLRRARLGQGQVLGITGEAGIGKSRLAVEIAQLSRQLGFAVHAGACLAEGTTAYLVWQPIWRSLLEVDAALTAAEQAERLAVRVTRRDGSPRRAPLLAPVVNVPMAESDLTASLDPQARADLLQSLLLDQLRACASIGPIVLVLEDCHWIDPASRDLLELLARDVAEQPVLLVATTRPAEAPPPTLQPLAHLAHFTEIRVPQLPVEDAERLVSERIRALHHERDEAPRDVLDRIVGSAGGNPFHLEELVNFLFAGQADPRAVADALANPELPDNLFQLVLARTDQLGDGERLTLEVASVLGTRFPASWVWGSHPSTGTPEQVMRYLVRLAELDLLHRLGPGRDPELEFKHAITRDAVYASLSPGSRTAMHARVARFIEHADPDRLQQRVGLLAHHYGRTEDVAKQQLWFRAAADAAKAAFATETAIGWYERLRALTPAEQAGELLIELGDHLLLAARWGDAGRVYNRALEVAELIGDRRVHAEANRGLGSVLTFTQLDGETMNQAVDRLRLAVEEFDQLQDGRGLSRALERLTWVTSELGDLREALAVSERHLYVATEADDPVAISGALVNLGVVRRLNGEHDEALGLLGRALRVASGVGYQPGIILAANDLAGVLFERGDHDQSFAHFQRALSVAQQIGDRRTTAGVIGNVGECYRRRGEYERANRCFVYALRIDEEIGYRIGMAIIAENLAASVAAQGRDLEAEELLTRAITLAELLDAQYWRCEALHQYALLLAAAGRLGEAERRNREALRIAEAQHRGVLLGARLLSVRLRVALGRLERDTAMRELRELLMDPQIEPPEEAAVRKALWELDPTQEQLRRDAAELYRRLSEDAPTVEHRTAYERLTGISLEPPPPLPRPPTGISQEPPDLTEVMARLDLAIRQLDAELVRSD